MYLCFKGGLVEVRCFHKKGKPALSSSSA